MIHLFCALKCEAAPLVQRLRLRPDPGPRLFRTWINPAGDLTLTVTGTGKLAAARGVTHAGTRYPGGTHAWLNIGLAGHGDLAPGRTILAHKITDAGSGRSWYPQIVFAAGIPSAPVITLDQPSSAFREDALYDMEAAGFFEAATACATAELCHSLKIVSDNRSFHYSLVTPRYATELIDAGMDAIEEVLKQLRQLQDGPVVTPAAGPAYETLLSRWHFTHAEQHRLRRLLHRWQVLLPEAPPAPELFQGCRRAGQVLQALDSWLDRAPYRLPGEEGA